MSASYLKRKILISKIDSIIKDCQMARGLLIWHPKSDKLFTNIENACEQLLELVELVCLDEQAA